MFNSSSQPVLVHFKLVAWTTKASVRSIEDSVADVVDVENVVELEMNLDRLNVPAITVESLDTSSNSAGSEFNQK